MAKEKNQRLTTPRGRAVYPYLNKPDTKFDADGVYHTKLAVPAKAAEELVAAIDAAAKKALEDAKEEVANLKAKGKKVKDAKECEDLPYSYDEEKDEFVFSFKMKSQVKGKDGAEGWTQKPAIFDAKGKPVDKTVRVGGGSTLRVSFEIVTFFQQKIGAGVSLRLRAVQVIELKEYGTGDASTHGFGEEEDGTFAADEGADADDTDESDEDESNEGAAKDGGDF